MLRASVAAIVIAVAGSAGPQAPDGSADPVAPGQREAPPSTNIERTDWLTFAEGALFVRQSGMAVGSSGRVLGMIDGNPRKLTLSTDAGDPIELVYRLPADTAFDRFAIPNVVETPGNATFFRTVVISGSLEGSDTGFQVLAAAELVTHGPDQQMTVLVPDLVAPVRWVKIDLTDGINIEPGHEGRTNLEFTEVIGNGVQEVHPPSTAFSGVWDFRLAERPDMRGTPFALRQTGSTITGCLGTATLRGTVNGSIARATGVDAATGRPVAVILVADDDGVIHGAWSQNNRVFGARTAVVDPAVESPCAEDLPPPAACGSVVYVNFEVDSAVLRPESYQVLSDLYDRLLAAWRVNVSIVGHTSTEGTEDDNLALSERRAQAVVYDLVGRGYDASTISATGRGESEPLIPRDDTESARSINRRVEIDCQR